MFGNEQPNGVHPSLMTFFSPIQGGIDPPDFCNVMVIYHYLAAFMPMILHASKPECIRFEGILESGWLWNNRKRYSFR